VTHPLRRLIEQEEAQHKDHLANTGAARWMVPYADFMTLLLAFFVVLFATVNAQKPLAQTPEKAEPTKTQPVAQVLADETPLAQKVRDALKDHADQVTIRQDERGVVLSFQDRLFFATGEATLTDDARQTLAGLAPILKALKTPLRVEGHTDNTPIQTVQFPSNWELSTARATQMVKALVEDYQFSPQHLSAAGYGEYQPIAKNSTIEGKQKNRRVDIVVLHPMAIAVSKVPHQAPEELPSSE
jgi:chemotaxis protein MotB